MDTWDNFTRSPITKRLRSCPYRKTGNNNKCFQLFITKWVKICKRVSFYSNMLFPDELDAINQNVKNWHARSAFQTMMIENGSIFKIINDGHHQEQTKTRG